MCFTLLETGKTQYENIIKLIKDAKPQLQEVQVILSRINIRKTTQDGTATYE